MTAAIDTTQPGTCRGCGATVYWRREKSGKASPYDPREHVLRHLGATLADELFPEVRQ